MLKFPPLPTTAELIKIYGLSAKQKLSQNFLLDLNITDRIVSKCGPLHDRTILEVGPGPGSLTRSLLKFNPKKLILVEKDRRFLSALESLKSIAKEDQVHIHIGDVLNCNERELFKLVGAQKTDWENVQTPNKVIGNLPFGVATELLIKWVHQLSLRSGFFAYGRIPMILTFQKEVAMRITARPKTKEYGRLSIMVQNWCDAKCLFDIKGSNFVPPPKVTATLVYIEPRITPKKKVSIESLEYVCRQIFSMRRKTMKNAITQVAHDSHELLTISNIDPAKRPEELDIEEFCTLADNFDKWDKKPPDTLMPFTKQLEKLLDTPND